MSRGESSAARREREQQQEADKARFYSGASRCAIGVAQLAGMVGEEPASYAIAMAKVARYLSDDLQALAFWYGSAAMILGKPDPEPWKYGQPRSAIERKAQLQVLNHWLAGLSEDYPEIAGHSEDDPS